MVLPAALSQILTDRQIAMPICLIVVPLVAEIEMGWNGLIASMLRRSRFTYPPGDFAGIFEISVPSLSLNRPRLFYG